MKQDEIDWLGLDEILNKDKVTRDEVEQHIRDNRVEIQQTELSGTDADLFVEYNEPEVMKPEDVFGSEHGGDMMFDSYLNEPGRFSDIKQAISYTEFSQETKNKTIEKFKNVYSDEGSNIQIERAQFEPDEIRVLEEAGNRILADEYYSARDRQVLKHIDRKNGYVILGNDELGYSIFENDAKSNDYRNRLETDEVYSLNEAKVQLEEMLREEGLLTDNYFIAKYSDYTQPGGTNYRELLLTLPQDSSKSLAVKRNMDFSGSHYDQENIVAHMRVSDRLTLDDKKVLYAEEIQSDWGQQGRNEGFKPNISKEESDKLNAELFDLREASDAKMQELKSLGTLRTDIISDEWLKLKKEHLKIQERQVEIQKILYGPPEAPFVTSTDKWTQLTIKKLLANAVDEGDYDYIAISPGQVQFDRWNQPGLRDYYDKVIPKNVDKVVKKLDKDAVEKIDMVVLTDIQPTLGIKLTDKLKEKVRNGQALFSVPAAVAAGAIASGEDDGN